MSMKVLGVDLSMTSTGLAFAFTDWRHKPAIVTEIVTSKGRAGATYQDVATRFENIRNDINYFYNDYVACVDLVVMEGPSLGSMRSGGTNNHRIAGLWWLIYDYFAMNGDPVAIVQPKARAKYITGNGNSDKETVLAHAIHYYGDHEWKKNSHDVADAIGLAAMGARHLGQPIEAYEMHEDNLAALEKVQWPS